jgi:beta-glucanase (GH16 family)
MLQQIRTLASAGRRLPATVVLAGWLTLLVGCGTAPAHSDHVASSRRHGATPVPLGVAGSWKLVLNSEFGGTTLNTRIWRPDWFGASTQITAPINVNEVACYNPGNVTFPGDGAMNLSVTHVSSTCKGVTHPYSGAIVSTNPEDGRNGGGFQFTYGVIQAEIYVPAARGLIANWPVFTTLGQDWPVTGEDDLMEGIAGTVCSRFHSPINAHVGLGGCDPGFTAGWHIVTANWAPNSITWYYDGVSIYHESRGVTSAPMYIVLVNSVSANWLNVAKPATMKVAYVRVWQPSGAPAAHPKYKYSF